MRSITNKIALMLIVALIVSFAAISAVSYYTAENKVVQLVSQNQAQILKDVDAVMDSFFHDYMEVANKIAQAVAKTDNDGDAYMAQTKFQKDNANSLVSFVFYGREDDGYFFQSDGTRLTPEKDNYDPRKRGWYMEAKAANKPIYTEPYKAATYNALVISFAAPVVKDGKFVGAIGFDIQIDALSKKILDMGKTEYGYVYVMNKDGL
ncbi:cache domain-containing protein, partial [Campylobacter showae]|uniref:cache domain-containing protein n=1 Tax=Campylobacter showae TaxID=204 RepID=UPI0028D76FA5